MICCLVVVFAPLVVAGGETTTDTTTDKTSVQTSAVTQVTPTTAVQHTTGFRREPSVVFQPTNTKITKDEDGAIELYIANPEANDVTLRVCVEIYVPPNLHLYGLHGGDTAGTGVVTAAFDIASGERRTVKALIRSTRTGVYIVDCNAAYYPVGHNELARDISSSYEMTVEATPAPIAAVTPTQHVLGFGAMFVILGISGVFYLLMRQR